MTAITADRKNGSNRPSTGFLSGEKGFDGIDIDWEYPDNDTQWYHFSLFLGEVRSAMGANGMSLSSAINPYYLAPTSEMMDLLDFVNVMSYDRGGQHSGYGDGREHHAE